ncbi:hypothetical protein KAR29_04735 [Aminithiophilus ramosus]|uniref:Fibronectin type-III domain-containing protein n=1 Tax=Aminithiophilus ramosus TaxID=3029084 RepID=A0A9Q7EWZ5_9BACT|nr:phage tail protein [Aminithiophilus ramosus]QTX33204.1 hypothetical protein KAR29_04735 [Aminithiophilus ramosus]
MEKLTVTRIRNPFSPSDRKISTLPYRPGVPLSSYLERLSFDTGAEYTLSVNGRIVSGERARTYVPEPWDWVTLVPVVRGGDGKNPLAVIASLLVPVVAMGVGSMIAGGSFAGAGMIAQTAWGWQSYLGAAATLMVGGSLINSLFSPANVDLPDLDSGQVYRWGKMQALVGQGYPVPLLHGTVRTAGQILAEHVSTDGEKQYYNVLLCLAEGPVDEISEIRINDNPVENFSDVWVHVRTGENDQTVIDGFDDTYADQSLSYVLDMTDPQEVADVRERRCDTCDRWRGRACLIREGEEEIRGDRRVRPPRSTDPAFLCADYAVRTWGDRYFRDSSPTWSTHRTEGDSGEGIEVVLDFSQGLYHADDQGEQEETHVDVEIQYRRVGTSSWTPWVSERIACKETSPFQRFWRADHIPAGRYEVRARVAAKEGTSLRYANKVVWTTLSHIVYDDFIRPGKALLAIRALATDQLSGGRPNVTASVRRSTVRVRNPATGLHEARAADNPAWACYDVLHRCRRLKDVRNGAWVHEVQGVPADRIVYADFAAWAEFCDAGALKVNYLLGEATDLWTALQVYEDAGRGKAILRGTRWSCMWDGPSEPVQLFSVGNVLKDSFQEEFLSLTDRANAVEATFRNASKGYEQDTLTVYDEGFDREDNLANPTQIRLDGVTTFEQAYREAKYRLSLNKYILRTCTWVADVDAIACQVGDVVRLQHDVPRWGWGGRLVGTDFREGATNIYDADVSWNVWSSDSANMAALTTKTGRNAFTVKGVSSVPGAYSYVYPKFLLAGSDCSFSCRVRNNGSRVLKVTLRLRRYGNGADIASATSFQIRPGETEAVSIRSEEKTDIGVTCAITVHSSSEDGTVDAEIDMLQVEAGHEVTPYVPAGVTRPDSDILVLDREVTLESGKNYAVMVRRADDVLVERELLPVYETTVTDRVTLNGYLAESISPGDTSFEFCSGVHAGDPANSNGVSTSMGEGWTAATHYNDSTLDVASAGRLGGRALRVRKGTLDGWTAYVNGSVRVEPGRTYRASIWCRANSTVDPDPPFLFYGTVSSDRFHGKWIGEPPGSRPGLWVKREALFTVSVSTKGKVYLYGSSSGGSDGDTWEYDDYHLEEVHDPEGGEVYSLGEVDRTGKDFRVIRVTREEDLKVRLVGIEYVPEVYDERTPPDEPETIAPAPVTSLRVSEHVDAGGKVFLDVAWTPPRGDYYGATVAIDGKKVADLPQFATSCQIPLPESDRVVVGVTTLDALGFGKASAETIYAIQARTVPQVSGISLEENSYVLKDGTVLSDVKVSWNRPNYAHIRHFAIYCRLDDGEDEPGGISTDDSFVLKALPAPRRVTVSVAVVNSAGCGGLPLAAPPLTLTGKSAPPPNVTGLKATVDPLDRGRYLLSWNGISLEDVPDLRGYAVRKGATWASGVSVGTILPEPRLSLEYDASGTYVYHVRALDNSGNLSVGTASITVVAGLEPGRPTNLGLALDDTDKSWGTLSWTPSPGKDIVAYDVRRGSAWEKAVSLGESATSAFRVRLSASGAVTFLVRARTRRGASSSTAQLATTVDIDPRDVTGFSAEQRADAKNVVLLSWDAPVDRDVAYFEIREGTSWDGGEVIGAHVSGLFLEHRVSIEKNYTWWIRAVSVAGNPSLNPVPISRVVGLVPSPPSGLAVAQDPYDRTRVAISWVPSPDADVTGYEVRDGISWEAAEILGVTADPRLNLTLAVSTDLAVKVRARNSSGFLSAEISASLSADLEPSNVAGFQAAQDGTTIDMLWDRVDEPDVVGYEIREGSSWETGTVLVTGLTQTGYVYPVATERTFRVHVKALTRAGFHSSQAASASVAVTDLPPKNVLLSWDELTLGSGTHDGTAFGPSEATFATLGGRFSDYPTDRFNEAGAAEVLMLANKFSTEGGGADTDWSKWGHFSSSTYWNQATVRQYPDPAMGMCFESVAENTTYFYDYYPYGFGAGRTYHFGVWLKSSVTQRKTLTAYLNSNLGGQHTVGGTAVTVVLPSGEWVRVACDITATEDVEVGRGGIGLNFGGGNEGITYSAAKPLCREYTGIYSPARKDIGRIVTADIGAEFIPSFAAAAGTNAALEYRTSRDGSVWTPWRVFSPRQETFRYIEARVLLSTTDPTGTPEVGTLKISVDMPDVAKSGRIAVPSGGGVVHFGYTFTVPPSLVVSADGANRRAEITSGPSVSQATVKVLDAAGSDVGGTLSWYVAGY